MYRNVVTYSRSGKQVVWESTWDEFGKRINLETEIKPYLMYEDVTNSDTTYMSMYGRPLRKLEFENSFERNEWIKTSKGIPLFEKLSPTKQYLLNKYSGQERSTDFIKNKFKVFFLDIEVKIDGCFPEPEFADYPINVISIADSLTNIMYVWTYHQNIDNYFDENDRKRILSEVKKQDKSIKKIDLRTFNSEISMLEDFLTFWEQDPPDIITGWNIDRFDVIYIVNRIIKIMGEKAPNRLSPVPWMKRAISKEFDKDIDKLVYKIAGVSICDYLRLYKNFTKKSMQSFKLDYISNVELGLGKLDYYEIGYESMQEFMEKDFVTFTLYNIIDTDLVKLIDDHKQFIALMRKVCNFGLVEYENIFKSIPYILGALVIQAREKHNCYFLTDSNKPEDKKDEATIFQGAFVYPTEVGYYKSGIISMDFNSLYPSVIRTLNLSPETKVGKVISEIGESTEQITIKKTSGKLVTITRDQFNRLLDEKCTMAANGVLFIKPGLKFGIVPSFLTDLYSARVSIKKEMKVHKQRAKDLDDEIKKLEKELKEMK